MERIILEQRLIASNTYLFLSGFKYIPVVEEEGLHLVDTPRRHEDEVENGEEPELEVERAVAHLPEGEAAEESGEDVEVDFIPDVVLWRSISVVPWCLLLCRGEDAYRRAPELDHHSVKHHPELLPSRGGVLLATLLLVAPRCHLGIELVEHLQRLLTLRGSVPHVYPVDGLLGVSLDNLHNMLSRVYVRRARRAVPREVVQHLSGLLSGWEQSVSAEFLENGLGSLTVAKIRHSPPFREEEQGVECVEEDGGWLVDCALAPKLAPGEMAE